jgi:hypothetical protein
MSPNQIRRWFETLPYAGELVFADGVVDDRAHDPLRRAWAAAQAEAIRAYEDWRERRTAEAFVVYRAAAARADAAQDALAAASQRAA